MRVSSIGHLTGVQLPYGIHLAGVRLGQACGSHRTCISQTCALDRCATLTGHTLTGHVSHERSDFGANGQVDTNCPYCPPQRRVGVPSHRDWLHVLGRSEMLVTRLVSLYPTRDGSRSGKVRGRNSTKGYRRPSPKIFVSNAKGPLDLLKRTCSGRGCVEARRDCVEAGRDCVESGRGCVEDRLRRARVGCPSRLAEQSPFVHSDVL
jgi:hypothetical protein